MVYDLNNEEKDEPVEGFDLSKIQKIIIDPQVEEFIHYFESLGITLVNNAAKMAYSIRSINEGKLWVKFVEEINWDPISHSDSDIYKNDFLQGKVYYIDPIFSTQKGYVGSTLQDIDSYILKKINDYAKDNKIDRDPEHYLFAGFTNVPLVCKNNKWPEGQRFTSRALMIFYEYFLKSLNQKKIIKHLKEFGTLSENYKSYLESESKKPHLN